MTYNVPRILPLGENAVVVEFGTVISKDLNLRAVGLADYLNAHPFPGYIESVPAYASTTVFFDLREVKAGGGKSKSAFDAVSRTIWEILPGVTTKFEKHRPVVEICANFDRTAGPDLELVAQTNGLSTSEVIDIFTSSEYSVYMIGFLPGFAYMGEVDERISMPRKQQPRQSVPKGSIGLAGRQTGIYPLESPGGWQLVGRTEIELFTPHAGSPSLLRPGDRVRFVRA